MPIILLEIDHTRVVKFMILCASLWLLDINFDGTNMKGSINVPSKFKVLKTKNPCKSKTYRDLLLWVPGGTRTHDIQNHNLTL